ncbi:MAG: hypothetical protein ACLPHE_12700 [Methanobacterium sp.]
MIKTVLDFSEKIKKLPGIQSIILTDKTGWGESIKDSNITITIIYRRKDKQTVKKIDSLKPEKFHIHHFNMKELKDDPHFWDILYNGIILYGQPVTVKAEDIYLKAKMIISYDTSKLNQNERSRLNRALYGGISTFQKNNSRVKKQYPGLIEQIDAQKIGKAVLIVNRLNASQIIQTLERYSATWTKMPIWSY